MDPTVPTLPEPDRLERLVTLIGSAMADAGWYGPHVLIKVVDCADDPESFELGFKELPDDAHPADELWGFRAPSDWLAIGVVTYGWLSPMGGCRPSQHPERQRVRLTTIVDRDGRAATSAAVDDGTFIDENGEGLISEVLRLCIGAGTAPPPPLEVLTDRLWLMAVAAASEHRSISWPRVEALRVPPDSSWPRLRLLAARSGTWPGAADWMDDGFFARELLARLPPLDELLERTDRQLARGTARKLRAAIETGGGEGAA